MSFPDTANVIETPAVNVTHKELMEKIKPNEHAKNAKGQAYRIVFVDGSNFLNFTPNKMYDHERHDTIRPNARAVLLLVHSFLKAGFEVIFVCKEYYRDPRNCLHHYVLEYLAKAGIVQFLKDELDDDAEVLKHAQKFGGFVLSNDNFKQDRYQQYSDVIQTRKIGFSCQGGGVFNPKGCFKFSDRFASNLQIHLHKSLNEFKQIAICQPLDPMFPVVKYMESKLSSDYHSYAIKCCEFISDYHRLKQCYVFIHEDPQAKVESPAHFDFKNNQKMPDTFDEYYDIYVGYSPLKASDFGFGKKKK